MTVLVDETGQIFLKSGAVHTLKVMLNFLVQQLDDQALVICAQLIQHRNFQSKVEMLVNGFHDQETLFRPSGIGAVHQKGQHIVQPCFFYIFDGLICVFILGFTLCLSGS